MTTHGDPKSGLLRALGVINLIAARAPETLGVSTVARELDLPKAVAHRILKEFTAAGYLVFDERTKQYRLGPAVLTLGLAALRELDVPKIARPHLDRLVAATGETATLSVRSDTTSRVYVDQVLSPHEIRMSISLGTTHPLHAGSSSKAILAHLPEAEIEEYLAHAALDPVTAHTITSVDELRVELAQVRAQGYAVSLGERQAGAGSVAAPIHRADGDVFGSISLCGPRDRFVAEVRDSHARLVVKTAAEISAELGHTPQEATP
ncbi:IclR family transcriptional regulator [Nocardioides marmotae]|uniref:Helix-turn-helix domain-containing protein n=1 Tax=Nocardioides marmotae TaxID=2663857 RepID=A0A6I3J4T4_9ACTN|nr:IclR family transcriptional regulator [Nocardioides marmotae]MCR6030506.1 helix-turn-helix domain-containing protein [Gordonia jinghuaiqii]MBC9734637.1 IclR family transcriptional regulator [Nocardioides marmotae]MTB85739.1 helix-turn-helix domain-containing protein [Nocardioides marmotae]MTB94142.1 helix-turn-helix domain-containing protein [Nocardioides marmotae]QKE00438.1 IclR family transcriptional regulator [Nocardioides marmotae]